ncbi:glycosyl transferase family 28 [Ferruginibacter lapsinanis]|uniref:glycosyltransferase n=1 Tax=Ferruginibacter lapsinanis TaxID=563172 RepID=UPI001E35167C|nr:glycosyltransferase [Ferruginibacter lapsinanis]UEG50852.1 glycosyl transferase family 28 [Ferruginibacter lapsinanis]
MRSEEFNNLNKQPNILVAPLGWGLGHATRCIPIIKELILLKCKPIIAGDNKVVALLKAEFPEVDFLPLVDYNIRYSRSKYWMPLKMLLQVPHIIKSMYIENRWLKGVVKKYNIDAVISDNRFGLYHSSVPTVYITHQLLIKTGNTLSEWVAQKIHYHFIKKYTRCWVPDFAGNNNLAGALSHPVSIPSNVMYIGGLSRFEKREGIEKKYDLLIVISGPEPQRTIFEKLLLHQLQNYKGTVLLVRGLPDNSPVITAFNSVTIKNHLSAKELSIAIQQSQKVISRSGYTTVMDMVKLQQKVILVPTPGQTEQEYLADYLYERKIFFCLRQNEFILTDAISQSDKFSYSKYIFDMNNYKDAVKNFTDSL